MIRVLNVLTDSNIGGAGRLLVNYLHNFDRSRFDVTVALPEDSALIPAVEAENWPVVGMKYGRDKSWDRRSVGELKRIIREVKPQIVHTHSSLSARVAAWECGVPCRFYTRHCAFEPSKKLTSFPGKQINGILNRVLNTDIVAVAEAAKKNLTDTGVPEDMITVIINGVEPLRTTTAEENDRLRNELGIGREDFVCGIVARLEDYKGHSYLLESAAEIVKTHPGTVFLIVGEGTQEQALKEQARELGIAGNAVFTGFADDVAPYYGIMDLNVNCSWGTETSSLALSEGMSVGVPAVATTYGGNPYMITEGVNGLLVPEKDPAALTEAVLKIMEDPALLARLSEGARRMYREKFTAAAMTRQLERLYEASATKHIRG